ncbi:hypothetical protein [Lihuaxuella thermophila]|uniref:Uncharacterized protein n=1 Tax=Lihuaxuella thermophila TaxID=1173111 RepID=A0A1H8FWF7_9BACL|nr:hypothetical protein [Lihuaxuella thermophila]SEN35989.1 hypothetical protein SAMN05444955_109110 [Lihuaxuella thermophila]
MPYAEKNDLHHRWGRMESLVRRDATPADPDGIEMELFGSLGPESLQKARDRIETSEMMEVWL